MKAITLLFSFALTSALVMADEGPCLELVGCFLVNGLTGYRRELAPIDTYEIVQDESMWKWSVECVYDPMPAVVTFVYPTFDGKSEKNEFHSPFFMNADDHDNIPYGVNPFMSSCGAKAFEVYAVMPGCGTGRTTYTIDADCGVAAAPASQPTMGPSVSPCTAVDLVLDRAASILDAFKGKVASKSVRKLKKDKGNDDKVKDKGSEDKVKDKGNDDKVMDQKDDMAKPPFGLSFDFVSPDGENCGLNIGAVFSMDTKFLGIPIKYDADIVIHGIALASSDGDNVCVGGLHVGKADVYGIARDLLDIVEHLVLRTDLPSFINGMLGNKICL